jgi:hypothetical protein
MKGDMEKTQEVAVKSWECLPDKVTGAFDAAKRRPAPAVEALKFEAEAE